MQGLRAFLQVSFPVRTALRRRRVAVPVSIPLQVTCSGLCTRSGGGDGFDKDSDEGDGMRKFEEQLKQINEERRARGVGPMRMVFNTDVKSDNFDWKLIEQIAGIPDENSLWAADERREKKEGEEKDTENRFVQDGFLQELLEFDENDIDLFDIIEKPDDWEEQMAQQAVNEKALREQLKYMRSSRDPRSETKRRDDDAFEGMNVEDDGVDDNEDENYMTHTGDKEVRRQRRKGKIHSSAGRLQLVTEEKEEKRGSSSLGMTDAKKQRASVGHERRRASLEAEMLRVSMNALYGRVSAWGSDSCITNATLSKNLHDLTLLYDSDVVSTAADERHAEKLVRAAIAKQLDLRYAPRVHLERAHAQQTDDKANTKAQKDVLDDIFERIQQEKVDAAEKSL